MKRALLSLLLLSAVVSLSSQTPRPSAPEPRERGDLRAVMARALAEKGRLFADILATRSAGGRR